MSSVQPVLTVHPLIGAIIVILILIIIILVIGVSIYDKYIKPYQTELKYRNTLGSIIGGIVIISILIYLAYFYKGNEQFLKNVAQNTLKGNR
jgi:uncharacterized membrane protein